jgi:GTP cyclohydrolase I
MGKGKLVEHVNRVIEALELDETYLDGDFRVRTPERVSGMLAHVFREATTDPASAIGKRIAYTGGEQIVSIREIKFYAMCEHHFLPFFGEIYLAYIPNEHIVGFGSLLRLVEILTKRPQLQEKLTDSLVEHLQAALDPRGTAVHIRAQHLCSLMVANEHEEFLLETTSYRGEFVNDPGRQGAFLSRIPPGHS